MLSTLVRIGAVLVITTASIHAQQPAVPEDDPIHAPATEPLSDSELLVEMLTELTALREKVDRLEATLHLFLESVAMPSRGEVERLRAPQPVEDVAAGEEAPDPGFPVNVPRPAAEPVAAEPGGPFTYSVVNEWGRTPEMVANIGANISTLKGMVLAVPGWSSDEQLIDLGRELREHYADYDNINIEVFNDPESARRFAESGVAADYKDRVLTVSKFADSGRDLILLIRGESTTTILP
jgi:hypothetical protein